MTRRNTDRLERAITDLTDDDGDDAGEWWEKYGEPCDDCGGLPSGADAAEGLTAPFVTIECTCGDSLPEGATRGLLNDPRSTDDDAGGGGT